MSALIPECMIPADGSACTAFAILQEKIERQDAEIAQLRNDYQRIARGHDLLHEERDEARAEIECLRAELADLKSTNAMLHGLVTNRDAEISDLRTAIRISDNALMADGIEIERLRAALTDMIDFATIASPYNLASSAQRRIAAARAALAGDEQSLKPSELLTDRTGYKP